MSAPTDASEVALKRLGRYLIGHKRCVYKYPFQRAEGIEVYGDTDWSGCPRTRRSTSGGCVMIGGRCIRTWNSTQASVTLSSGEAEYYGLVKAAGAGLGHQSLMDDLGIHLPVRVWTDSSAALGIASRSALGKLRHLETHTLWVQEKSPHRGDHSQEGVGRGQPGGFVHEAPPEQRKGASVIGLV